MCVCVCVCVCVFVFHTKCVRLKSHSISASTWGTLAQSSSCVEFSLAFAPDLLPNIKGSRDLDYKEN